MSNVKFKDNCLKIETEINDVAIKWLYEGSNILEAQTKRNTAVDTGQLKNSWSHIVDEDKLVAVVGSPLENAIWEEFGTGEYALNNNGRKTPWKYKDIKGNWHTTRGKRPKRAFYNAFLSTKNKIIKRFEYLFKEFK